jgi:hypothetical protein
MGFKKDWDVSSVSQQIYRMARECSSPYNDGFTAFEIKKELHEIKFIIDRAMKDLPSFSGEEEWLTEQEKKRVINILKR